MIAEQLKKSILQAAIQGKLTQQLPEDGDARDLLKEIRKEKGRLIKEGKIKAYTLNCTGRYHVYRVKPADLERFRGNPTAKSIVDDMMAGGAL